MQRLLAVLVALVGLALFAVACGSGDAERPPAATETASSQRADRQATVLEQEQQQEAEVAVADEQAALEQQVEQVQFQQVQREETQAQQAQAGQAQAGQAQAERQVEAPQDTSDDQQVVVLPEDVVGEHKGVRSERNVLGDPDASVEILYYGDFT